MYTRAQSQARWSLKWFIWFYRARLNSLVISSWNMVLPPPQCRDFFYKLCDKSWMNNFSAWSGWPWQQRGVPGHSPCWHSSGCQLPWAPGSAASQSLPGAAANPAWIWAAKGSPARASPASPILTAPSHCPPTAHSLCSQPGLRDVSHLIYSS